MLHEPAANSGPDHASKYKMRLGIYMFVFYSIVYIGFAVINLVNPKSMGKIVFFGLNLAVVYGFGLIILAIVLSLIYNRMCTKEETRVNNSVEKEGGE